MAFRKAPTGLANLGELLRSSTVIEELLGDPTARHAGNKKVIAQQAGNNSGPVEVVRRPAGAKDTDCSLDLSSMWGTHLQDIDFDSTLKSAFRQIMSSINRAVNPHCQHVTISASLFSEEKLRGRTYKDAEVEEPLPYEGQAGCGIFVVSDWQAKILTNVSKSKAPGGWHLVPFPTDDFLEKIEPVHRSNELQRLFNLVKVGVPLFVSKDVKRVTFADVKCNLPSFSRRVEHVGNPKTDIYTFAHPNFFKRALMKEFRATWAHEQTRHEMSPVMNDMERLHKYVGDSFLKQKMEQAEIMCMSWERTERNEAVQSFARRWFWYTAHFTMRPQLTWNAALIDCGEGLKVNYLPFVDPRIKLIESISKDNQNSSTGEM